LANGKKEGVGVSKASRGEIYTYLQVRKRETRGKAKKRGGENKFRAKSQQNVKLRPRIKKRRHLWACQGKRKKEQHGGLEEGRTSTFQANWKYARVCFSGRGDRHLVERKTPRNQKAEKLFGGRSFSGGGDYRRGAVAIDVGRG